MGGGVGSMCVMSYITFVSFFCFAVLVQNLEKKLQNIFLLSQHVCCFRTFPLLFLNVESFVPGGSVSVRLCGPPLPYDTFQ